MAPSHQATEWERKLNAMELRIQQVIWFEIQRERNRKSGRKERKRYKDGDEAKGVDMEYIHVLHGKGRSLQDVHVNSKDSLLCRLQVIPKLR